MKYRAFGSMGWRVSEIGLGTFAIGGYWGPSDDNMSKRVIEKSYELGVNFYDTADVYGRGKSERFIAEIFVDNNMRSDIFIATKGGHDFYTSPPKLLRNFDVSYLDNALNRSLERLHTDYIDVYQLHGPAVEIMQQEHVFEFLEKAKKDGRIRAAGVSVYDLAGVEEALRNDVVDSVQFVLNILVNHDEVKNILSACATRGVGIIAREPLAQGLLTGKYGVDASFPEDDHRAAKWTHEYLEKQLTKVSKLSTLADKNRNLSQVALLFVLAHQEVSVVIPGARDLQQLFDNIRTTDLPSLTERELEIIRSIRIEQS